MGSSKCYRGDFWVGQMFCMSLSVWICFFTCLLGCFLCVLGVAFYSIDIFYLNKRLIYCF